MAKVTLTKEQREVQSYIGRPLEQDLRDRVTAGQSTRQIAEDYVVSAMTISRWCKKFGIDLTVEHGLDRE